MFKDRRAEYKIVNSLDMWWDYKVKYKPWWSLFWFDCWGVGNTRNNFDDLGSAEIFAKKHAQAKQSGDTNTIKKLGRLP